MDYDKVLSKGTNAMAYVGLRNFKAMWKREKSALWSFNRPCNWGLFAVLFIESLTLISYGQISCLISPL